ncbi:ABC transporter permease [Siminovitchia acidinfaciens]|uniref:ABC transporter permease n=1 Tax=Siminovitchia acidinfaciens TaxID=2321395 RepID=A0A429Y7D8_9BACI|nr:ABC transporter permease [Siminovitchia acidinfaciens]RST77293.1 ABC transporter permease [Siminovitchia acidinfaciens]
MIEAKQEKQPMSVYSVPTPGIFTRIPGLKWLLVVIPIVYVFTLLLYPMIGLFKLGVTNSDGFTLEYIKHIFLNKVYLDVILITLKISFMVTVITLLISYPIAYLLIRIQSNTWKSIIIALAMIPFWISLLVRTFSWIVMLQDRGAINQALMALGIIDEPIKLLYTTTGVVIGMVHVLYPFMFFSLFSVMKGIDQRLHQAAEGLGARPLTAFLQINLPLSLPGILAGSLLVFVMSLGFFVTPALLGGSGEMMISMVIENYINKTLNWHLASALSLVLFVVTVLILGLAFLALRNHAVLKDVT